MKTALEYILVSSYKKDMISWMKVHPEAYEEAVRLAVSDKQPYSWRAAWLLWSCMESNDPRIRRHIKRFIANLENKDDGHQRELLKILLLIDLSEEDEGFLFNVCVSVWQTINKAPSVRLTALKLIVKIAGKYPDLANEIKFLTREHYLDSLSPAVIKSISKLIKDFIPGPS